jgi:Protein of unknown function (DUF3619)
MNTRDDDRSRMSGEPFEREMARMLRQGAEELDAATLSRLNRARQKALEEYDRQRQRPAWLPSASWEPFAGATVVGVLAVALWLGRAPDTTPQQNVAMPAVGSGRIEGAVDLEVVLADDNLEMIEDLEFYDWLESGLATDVQENPGVSG